MFEQPPLLRIRRKTPRPTEAQIAALQGVPSAVASDALDGTGALAGRIRYRGTNDLPAPIVGPALTCWTGAADLMALHAAKAFVTPGDIVVHAFDNHQGCAAFGDSVGGMLKNAGVAAVVTDGPVRDSDGLDRLELKVWCTGTASASPYENGPGTVGLPVQIGGQTVDSGDMIIADRDGVVVVPFARIDEIAGRAAHIMALEQAGDAEVQGGLVMPDSYQRLLESDRIDWVD